MVVFTPLPMVPAFFHLFTSLFLHLLILICYSHSCSSLCICCTKIIPFAMFVFLIAFVAFMFRLVLFSSTILLANFHSFAITQELLFWFMASCDITPPVHVGHGLLCCNEECAQVPTMQWCYSTSNSCFGSNKHLHTWLQ